MLESGVIYSTQVKLECVERELRYRRRVYPRWIAEERISPHFAQEQIRIMEQIAEDYRKMEEGERLF